jgi:hypothetical protein
VIDLKAVDLQAVHMKAIDVKGLSTAREAVGSLQWEVLALLLPSESAKRGSARQSEIDRAVCKHSGILIRCRLNGIPSILGARIRHGKP